MRKTPLLLRICKKIKPLFPSEALYLKTRFRLEMGYRLNLRHPKTFSEKIQWLKLYNRRPEYTTMVDKYAVKEYVAKKIGSEYVIPTLGLWDTPDEIDFDALPNRFVLKTTHGGGGDGVVIIKDKNTIDKNAISQKLRSALKQDIAYYSCEWPYKNVPRRIIAEDYIEPALGASDLRDYKFFCFNGKVQFLKVDIGRFTNHHANYYNRDFQLLPFGEALFMPDREADISKPEELDLMISLAERLANEIPFIRVDMYNVNGRILFGELTFFPASGLENYNPVEWDKKIGNMLQLPLKIRL